MNLSWQSVGQSWEVSIQNLVVAMSFQTPVDPAMIKTTPKASLIDNNRILFPPVKANPGIARGNHHHLLLLLLLLSMHWILIHSFLNRAGKDLCYCLWEYCTLCMQRRTWRWLDHLDHSKLHCCGDYRASGVSLPLDQWPLRLSLQTLQWIPVLIR